MTKDQVEGALVGHLLDRDWDVTTADAPSPDVIARRGAELLVAAATGRACDDGTDLDIGYG